MHATFLLGGLLLAIPSFVAADETDDPLRGGNSGAPPDARWQTIAEGDFVTVAVERAVYQRPGDEHFLMRFRITNRWTKRVGVQLASYPDVLHPNQWGVHPTREREIVDESRSIPKEVDPQLARRLIRFHALKRLAMIEPGKSFDYFRDFNGDAQRAAIDRATGRFLIVSFDGQMFVTDGERVTDVNCDSEKEGAIERTSIAIPHPVDWQLVPKGAKVVLDIPLP